jgi:hypothetical protein
VLLLPEALVSASLVCCFPSLWTLLWLTWLAAEDGDEEGADEGTPSKTPKKKKSGSGKGKASAKAEAEEGEDVLVKDEKEGSDGADELAWKATADIRKAAGMLMARCDVIRAWTW